MMLRLLALVLVAGLAGCAWESRPDGGEAVHSDAASGEAGVYGPRAAPLGGDLVDAEVIEPLDGSVGADAPIPTPQPAPTTGPSDATPEVDEAPSPGTDR